LAGYVGASFKEKTEIYYFTGTGNSLDVDRDLAEKNGGKHFRRLKVIISTVETMVHLLVDTAENWQALCVRGLYKGPLQRK